MNFIKFMASSAGRALRIVLGVAMNLLGWFMIGGPEGATFAIIGMVPLMTGILNVCVLAPLAGLPFFSSRMPGNIVPHH